MRALVVAALVLISPTLSGCAAAPPDVAELLVPQQRPAAQRHFHGVAAQAVPAAVVTVLQDLGFHITASEPELGLIVATRGHQKTLGEFSRDFVQDFLQEMRNVFMLRRRDPRPEKVVGPAGFSTAVSVAPSASGSAVRVSFHRFVSMPTGEAVVVWADELPGPEPHARFFALLAEALATSRR